MNLVEAVAGRVIAELLEVTAFAHLPLRVQSERAAIQEQRGEMLALGDEVWENANLAANWRSPSNRPEPQSRGCF